MSFSKLWDRGSGVIVKGSKVGDTKPTGLVCSMPFRCKYFQFEKEHILVWNGHSNPKIRGHFQSYGLWDYSKRWIIVNLLAKFFLSFKWKYFWFEKRKSLSPHPLRIFFVGGGMTPRHIESKLTFFKTNQINQFCHPVKMNKFI